VPLFLSTACTAPMALGYEETVNFIRANISRLHFPVKSRRVDCNTSSLLKLSKAYQCAAGAEAPPFAAEADLEKA